MQLLKNKFLIIVVALGVFAIAGGFFTARHFQTDTDRRFAQEGYVLGDPVETAEGGYISPQIHFSAGTSYKTNYASELVFENAEKSKSVLSDFGFAHYQDGSTLSLRNGVLMDPSTVSETNNVICYNVSAGDIIQKNGSAYTINHLGRDLTFDSVAWKVGDEHYFFGGDAIALSLGQGAAENIGAYAEVRYIDNGVMQITSENGETYVTVSPDCTLTLDDRMTVNLSDGTIQNGGGLFALNRLLIDNPDNFSISGITSANGVKLPEFVAEDGKEGESGDSGDEGEAGEAGPAGTAGTPGTAGAEGAEGSGGASGTGGPAGAGTEEEDDGSGESQLVSSIPDFTLPKLGVATGDDFTVNVLTGLHAKISVTDTDAPNYIPVGNVTATIVNTKTGAVVWSDNNLNGGQPIAANDPISFDILPDEVKFMPGVEYKLTVSGNYDYKGQTYTKEFLKRTFTGGDIGIDFVISDITSNSIKINITKETWSAVTMLKVALYGPDENGNEIQLCTPKQINALTDLPNVTVLEFGGAAYDDSNHANGNTPLPGLRQNTTFRIELIELSDGTTTLAPNLGKTLAAKTLLAMNGSDIWVYAPGFSTNRFDRTVSVWPGQIKGLNLNAIKKYTYQFFESTQLAADGTLLSGERPMLELTTDGRSSQLANVAYAGTGPDSLTGYNYLLWNKSYRVRLVVEYYDNSKTWEFQGAFSDAFGISGALFPTIEFIPDPDLSPSSPDGAPETLYDAIKGTLRINANGATFKSQQNDGSTPRITVQYRSAEKIGFVKTVTYDLPAGAGGTVIDIPINVQGLMEASYYTMAIYGFIDFNDGNGGSITNLGMVTVPNAGISLGSLSALTAEPNEFLVVLQDLNDPQITLPTDVSGLTGVINALFCLTDKDANDSSEYEAARLATVEFELYGGNSTAATKLGTAKLTSHNAVPGESSLGAIPNPAPATPTHNAGDLIYNSAGDGYKYYYILTERDFGLTSENLKAYPVVTIHAKQATDYTTHPGWSLGPNYFNDLPLTGTRDLALIVRSIAPALPEVNNAFEYNLITEGTRTRYFTGTGDFADESLRPGYDPNTVIGFSLQAKFGAPSIANSFTYKLYRSGIESETITIDPSELFDSNRVHIADVPMNIIKDTSNPYAYTVPRLIVLFGSESDYNITYTNNATYYCFMNNDPEGKARGYTYYASYTADLDLAAPQGSTNGFEYPRDYNADGQNHADTVLYSRRLAAPLQKPIIKTYPSASDTGMEIWKYRMLDIDDAFIPNKLNTPQDSTPLANVTPNTLTKSTPSVTPSTYSEFKVQNIPEGAFLVRYKYNKWRNALSGYTEPDYTSLVQWYHEEPFTAAPNQDNAYDLSVNKTRNRLYVVFRGISEDDGLYRRLAIAKITVKNEASNTGTTQKDYYVPVGKAVAYDANGAEGIDYPIGVDPTASYLCAPIELQTLTADLKGGINQLRVSVDLYYDEGRRGFDVPSPVFRYAMQELKPVGTGGIFGDYFVRTAANATQMRPTASSLYYTVTPPAFTMPATETGFASYKYAVPLENRAVSLDFTLGESGAMERISGRYVAPKSLKILKSNHTSGAQEEAFTLPQLVPEVYDYIATPGLEEATVSFRVDGLSVLDGFGTGATIKLELWRRDLSSGGGTTDVKIGSWTNLAAGTDDSKIFNYYFGAGPVPAGYAQLNLNYYNGDGTNNGTNIQLNRLEKSMLYYFKLSGDIDSLTKAFFDHDITQTGREYQFRTSDNVKIGGNDGKQVTFSYIANSYTDKYIEASYPLTGPARGYYIEYVFTNSANVTQTIKDSSSVFAVGGSTNKTKIPVSPGDGFFNFGETYKVQMFAKTSSTDALIGQSAELTYTLPLPVAPQFIVTATPGSTAEGEPPHDSAHPWNYPTVFSINPIDPSCSIAGATGNSGNGEYIVRILNSSGIPVTASVTTGFSPSLAEEVFVFNKTTEKVQKITVSGKDLPSAKGYTLEIWAVVDAGYDGVATGDYISTHGDVMNTPNISLVRAIEFDVHNENEVTIGDVTVSTLPSSTRLIFENQINLNQATHIQYAITNLGSNDMPIASAPIPFTMLTSGTTPAYVYFDIPSAITVPGVYQIELRFTNTSGLYKEKTINYRKT